MAMYDAADSTRPKVCATRVSRSSTTPAWATPAAKAVAAAR